jgi:hypothetical protein
VCRDRLEAIQGNIRDWHYRHNANRECEGAPMTMLHRMAQQIMLEHEYVYLPGKLGRLSYSTSVKEGGVGPYWADIVVEGDGEKVY